MAKLSYLNMVNRVLTRITEPVITQVTTASGRALIATQLINEAQTQLFNEENWYSLYTTRTWSTVAGTATTAVATDWGRTIDLIDTTNNRVLIEEAMRNIDEADPDKDYRGSPTHFTIIGSNYHLYPIPAGVYSVTERYWKTPTTLATNTATSDLPIEVENCLILYTLARITEYLNKFSQSDRYQMQYEQQLFKAKATNKKQINKLNVMQSVQRNTALMPPMLPASFGMGRYFN